MTQFRTYQEYKDAMKEIRARNNAAIADDDKEGQRLAGIEAMRIINANTKWSKADRAWAGRFEDSHDDDGGDAESY